ncbi:insecticyanin-A-like isoform X2 [Aricia agestis]|uniref:insecticyanin-A-like isoform X2 n=1 Tax=Aricia agestis TaxID=91739 RepID=UPI001C20165D|nr:insecticyanin-A-like isoform X2 [Aricia agestis]
MMVTKMNYKIGRGIWYEVARYPYPSREPIQFLVYESRMEGDLYVAETINVNRTSPYFTEVFSRMLPDSRKRGRITFEFSSSERGLLIDSPVMYILAVDYDKFFIAYTCVYDESQNKFREHAWVLSRTPPIPGKAKRDFLEISKSVGLDEDELIWYH